MTDDDTDLPEWIVIRTDDKFTRELTERDVAREMYISDRPFYNIDKLQSRLPQDVSRSTIRNRLTTLTAEKDVLRTEDLGSGKLYWLNDPRSSWPIPPDFDPEREERGMTVAELRQQPSAQLGILAVLLAVIGPAIVLVAVFQSAAPYTVPISPGDVIAYGLLISITSYFALLLAVAVWTIDFPALRDTLSEMIATEE
jgi:hypothetical protein